jgi:hypothetical protein
LDGEEMKEKFNLLEDAAAYIQAHEDTGPYTLDIINMIKIVVKEDELRF